jgi:PAS domain S-box-containing protein
MENLSYNECSTVNNEAYDVFGSRSGPVSYHDLYQILMDSVATSIILLDSDMRIVDANDNYLRRTRQNKSEIIGKSFTDIFPEIIVRELRLSEQIREILSGREDAKSGRMAYRAPGVPTRIYSYRLVPVPRAGGARDRMFVYVCLEDVTEKIRLSDEVRQVECHLASVVEAASDLIVSTDSDGKIISWNRGVELATGYSLLNVAGRPFSDLIEPNSKCCWEKSMRDVIQEKQRVTVELEIRKDKGDPVAVSWTFSRMSNKDGSVYGIVAVGRDLTEQRHLQMQVLQSQRLAAMGIMAGGIAHEIRNPLSLVSSACQFLQDDDLPPEFIKECALKIDEGITRTSQIIESLIAFARPMAQDTRFTSVDMNAVIQKCISVLSNEVSLGRIHIVLDLPKQPVLVFGSTTILQQVILNILLNAIKAMSEGGQLRIVLVNKDYEAAIQISDTGCGIPKKDIDRIFDPFYTTKQMGDGMGLGLSFCFSALKEHFGAIEIESNEGVGSVFKIRLPTA